MEDEKLSAIRLLFQDFPKIRTWLAVSNDTRYLAFSVSEIDAWTRSLKAILDRTGKISQYVVVTIFQGKFDELKIFPTEPLANDYIKALKSEFSKAELEIVKRTL